MRLNDELLNIMKERQNKEIEYLEALREFVPDYDYPHISYSSGTLFITVDLSQLPEIINAFGIYKWEVSVTNYLGAVQVRMTKALGGKFFNGYLTVHTYDDAVKAIKENCGDWVKFG